MLQGYEKPTEPRIQNPLGRGCQAFPYVSGGMRTRDLCVPPIGQSGAGVIFELCMKKHSLMIPALES